ncbi:MAG: META domain-containing protein [Deltaproteobacteria bacterium]|nr:META domain-containing protein [Deltaproteobacteria bacterium]
MSVLSGAHLAGRRRWARAGSALLVLCLVSSCASPWVAVAPRVPTEHEKLGPASAEVCGDLYLFTTPTQFIPHGWNERLEGAVEEAVASVPGATALADVTYQERWYWWVLASRRCVRISGDFLFGCAGTPVPFGSLEPVAYDESDPVDIMATECGAQVLLFFPFFNNGRAARAFASIQEKAGDRYIADVRMREQWTYLVFGIVQCTDMVARTYPRLAEVGVSTAASEQILDVTWVWKGTQYSDGTRVGLEKGDGYNMVLATDPENDLQLKISCNRGRGSYQLKGSTLNLEVGISTRAMCPEPEVDNAFVGDLNRVTGYRIEGGKLTLQLSSDAGVMHFEESH